jgi:uncharacterized protein (DUF1330 family)
MTVYVVFLLTITDGEVFQRYGEGFMEIFSKYDGQVLAATENPISIEGDWPYSRTVILSFPNTDALNRWYRSPEYQTLAKLRHQASTSQTAIIPGLGHEDAVGEVVPEVA